MVSSDSELLIMALEASEAVIKGKPPWCSWMGTFDFKDLKQPRKPLDSEDNQPRMAESRLSSHLSNRWSKLMKRIPQFCFPRNLEVGNAIFERLRSSFFTKPIHTFFFPLTRCYTPLLQMFTHEAGNSQLEKNGAISETPQEVASNQEEENHNIEEDNRNNSETAIEEGVAADEGMAPEEPTPNITCPSNNLSTTECTEETGVPQSTTQETEMVTSVTGLCESSHTSERKQLYHPFHTVVFSIPIQKFNSNVQALFSAFTKSIPYNLILAGHRKPQQQRRSVSSFSQELDNLQMMLGSSVADHRRKVCIGLLLDFGRDIEQCLLQAVVPYTDALIVTVLPYVDELTQCLVDKAISVYRIQLAEPITADEALVLVMLISKVLSESIADSGLLGTLECENQCFVFHQLASYLTTKNHALEGLVKLFPDQAVGFCILASPAKKHVLDLVDSMLNDIPRRFQSKFSFHSCQIVEVLRQLSPAAVLSAEQCESSTHTLPTAATSVPCVDSGISSLTLVHTAEVTTACEETGMGKLQNVWK